MFKAAWEDQDLYCSLVNLRHVLHLVIAFSNVFLIYANGVNPDILGGSSFSSFPEEVPKVLSDSEAAPINEDDSFDIGISP